MVIPDKAGPGVFMLQNGEWAGLHIAIKSHKVQAVSQLTLTHSLSVPTQTQPNRENKSLQLRPVYTHEAFLEAIHIDLRTSLDATTIGTSLNRHE